MERRCDPEASLAAVRRARSARALAALWYLAAWGRATAAELARAAGVSSSLVNSLLRPYVEAGLVEVSKVGGRALYSVSPCVPRSRLAGEVARVARRRGAPLPEV